MSGSRQSSAWAKASYDFAAAVRSDPDPEETLERIAECAAAGAGATGSLVFLPTLGDELLCEAGYLPGVSTNLVGTVFEAPFSLQPGEAVLLGWEELAALPWTVALDPASGMFLPIPQDGAPGVLALLRDPGNPFDPSDVDGAAAFSAFAGLVLDLTAEASSLTFQEVEEERHRIAADLHDLAIQGLFATGMRLRGLEEQFKDAPQTAGLRKEIDGALAALEDSVGQIRFIVEGLKGSVGTEGFVDSLRQEASTARSLLGFAPTLVVELDGRNLSLAHSTPGVERANAVTTGVAPQALAVVREALTNVAKHAGATSASVTVSIFGAGSTGEIVIEVLDDGVGLEPIVTRESGIANMARRASMLSGSFDLGPGPRGRGTAVVWRAPLG